VGPEDVPLRVWADRLRRGCADRRGAGSGLERRILRLERGSTILGAESAYTVDTGRRVLTPLFLTFGKAIKRG